MKKNIVCLFGGGDIPSFSKEYLENSTIVGVDGGTNFLTEQGITPHIVVGDLDSVHPEVLAELPKSTKILKIEEQETTDFEKALYTIKADIYLCFGFLGNDLAHSIGIFHILQKKKSLYFLKMIVFSLYQKMENYPFLLEQLFRFIRLLPQNFFPLQDCNIHLTE